LAVRCSALPRSRSARLRTPASQKYFASRSRGSCRCQRAAPPSARTTAAQPSDAPRIPGDNVPRLSLSPATPSPKPHPCSSSLARITHRDVLWLRSVRVGGSSMSPEFPPDLMVLDFRYQGGDLLGTAHVVELEDRARNRNEKLRVSWNATTAPADFSPVCNGVVFVANQPASFGRQYDAKPDVLGKDHYGWRYPSESDLMMVLIFPPGYAPKNCEPTPLRSKEFQGRVAAYWLFAARSGEVKWVLTRSRVSPARSAIRINRKAPRQPSMMTRAVNVEDVTGGERKWPRADKIALVSLGLTAIGSAATVVALLAIPIAAIRIAPPSPTYGASNCRPNRTAQYALVTI
jgi:hypothetical protein